MPPDIKGMVLIGELAEVMLQVTENIYGLFARFCNYTYACSIIGALWNEEHFQFLKDSRCKFYSIDAINSPYA